jgi:lipopolysaccharide export system permease protein
MKVSATLSRYLARTYLFNFVILLGALLSIIYLFDTVELIRRGTNRGDVPLSLMLQMGLLKLPEVGQTLLPFAILFSAMFTFWQLTRRYELIIVRSSGFSVWQFLAPILTVALFIGVFQMTILNPVGALFLGKFAQLESTYLKKNENQVALFKEGFWLRQSAGDGYAILHAQKISRQQDWALNQVTVLFFSATDDFRERLDAKGARLEPGRWVFEDVIRSQSGQPSIVETGFVLPTELTVDDVEDSFASPETMSFWRLRGHIETLEGAGFDASRLRVHYHNLLSQPLMFMAMVLLAASVSMRPPRFRGAGWLFASGVMIGFIVFFLSSFLQALGSSNQIPVVMAAWSPACISFLLGLSVMINLEDG